MLFQCKIPVYDKQLDDLGIEVTKWVDFAVHSCFIVAVRDMPENDSDEGVVIYLASGDSFITDKTYDEVLRLMKNNS
jgi:hypothetical protein